MRPKKKYQIIFAAIMILISFVTTTFAATEVARTQHNIWSGYWWPTAKKEILIPLKIYDSLTGHKSSEFAASQIPSGEIPHWWGLCHAWSAASVLENEPTKSARIGSQNINVGDQKGWLSVCHDNDISNIYGDRFGDGVNDNKLDIAPDELWQILRRYIKEMKTPIILDLDPSEEVWNYPCYAYKVEHKPVSEGSNIHEGTLSIWCADSGVPKNFIGLKSVFQRYKFQVEMQENNIVMGTGKWIGESIEKHPDFAWFPFVVRSSNTEISYKTICKLLGRKPATPLSTNNTTRPQVVPVTPPHVTNPQPSAQPITQPSAQPITQPITQPSTQPEEILTEEILDASSTLTIPDLLVLLEGKRSDFHFDAYPEVFDGKYTVGDMLRIKGVAGKDGYLYLFNIAPDGALSVLFPMPEDDNRITAKKPFTVPSDNASYAWKLTEKGKHTIKAIVSEKPLLFSGNYESKKTEKQPEKQIIAWDELIQRIMPDELKTARHAIKQTKNIPSIEKILGKFSQDEIQIYISLKTQD
jgi:hypothetical protein